MPFLATVGISGYELLHPRIVSRITLSTVRRCMLSANPNATVNMTSSQRLTEAISCDMTLANATIAMTSEGDIGPVGLSTMAVTGTVSATVEIT